MGFFSKVSKVIAAPATSGLSLLAGGGLDGITGKRAANKAGKQATQGFLRGIEAIQTGRGNAMPFIDSLRQGATLGGISSRFDEILNSDTFAPLRKARTDAIQNSLAQAGLRRSGAHAEAIGNDLTDFVFGIEQMLGNREAHLAGLGTGMELDIASNVAGMHTGIGQAKSSATLAAQQGKMQLINGILGTAGALGSAALLSDERLKINIERIGDAGPVGHYKWDWIPELEALDLAPDMKSGVLAQEVIEVWPDLIYQVGPFLAVDYETFLERIN